MDNLYSLHLSISKLENNQFLATSRDLPGLVAQGRTIAETIEIAQDVARKLLESIVEHGDPIPSSLKSFPDKFELDVAVGVIG